MAKYTGGTATSKDRSSGIKDFGSDMRRAYADYRAANQPQMRITRRRLDTRATHTLPDGTSKKQNKPAAQTRLQSAVSNSAAGRVSKQGNAPAMSANAAIHRKPLKGFEPGEKRNLLQKGRSNKTK